MFALRLGVRRPHFRTAVEIWRDRERRLEEHRHAAAEFRRFASRMQDAERRLAFERAAQLHEAFAQTLEAVANESLEDVKSAHEKWLACEHTIEDLNRRRKQLEARRRSACRFVQNKEKEHEQADYRDRRFRSALPSHL
jgi:hypothetical protein